MHARNFATLVNISVAMKEMVHRLFKAIIPHSNKKNIELDFMRRDNCLQTLRFLMDGGIDERYDKITYFNFSALSKDRCVRMLFDSWYISPSIIDSEQEEEFNITCMDENFINIRVREAYNKNDLQTAGFERILNDDLFAELRHAYKEELGCIEHLASRNVKYFNSISYTIVDNDNRVDVNLRVGDTVDVLEDISNDILNNPKTVISYVQIQAIFIHTNNHLRIPFLLLNWFVSLEGYDSKLRCPRYRLQRLTDQTWRRIYVVKWVDH